MGAETRLAERTIRACRPDEAGRIGDIINVAAQIYHGVISDDCWHEPYMPPDKLEAEIAAGVVFQGIDMDGRLVAVMGLQPVQDVSLIRHAYVMPDYQGHGLGTQLLVAFKRQVATPILVGTWAAATWAIAFYERHGFQNVGQAPTADLLRRYWTISERQIETSVVLALQGLVKQTSANDRVG